jgi:hypothetical protein
MQRLDEQLMRRMSDLDHIPIARLRYPRSPKVQPIRQLPTLLLPYPRDPVSACEEKETVRMDGRKRRLTGSFVTNLIPYPLLQFPQVLVDRRDLASFRGFYPHINKRRVGAITIFEPALVFMD